MPLPQTFGGIQIPLLQMSESHSLSSVQSSDVSAVPLYWASWRHYIRYTERDGPQPLLADVHRVLREAWGLDAVEVQPWPSAPSNWSGQVSAWHFTESYEWPSFPSSATGPGAPSGGRWSFDGGTR